MPGTYIKKRGTISHPTFEVPGMTHNNKIRNAHAIRAGICSLILVIVFCSSTARFPNVNRLNSKR